MKDKKPQTEEKAIELAPVKGEAEQLIAMAIDKNLDVDKLERLIELRRQTKQEQAREAFDRAMADFQSRCPVIEKKTKGYNYKYADLTTIVEQVKGLLSENGFSYTFDTDEAAGAVVIYCKVKHIAGHMETSKATITKETTTKMNASQQSGAAMTYGKRYAFVNAFGLLTGDEDTDAASESRQTTLNPRQMAEQIEEDENSYRDNFVPRRDTTAPQEHVENGNGTITEKQAMFVKKLVREKDTKGRTESDLLETYQITDIMELTREQASDLIAKLIKLPRKNIQPVIDVDPDDIPDDLGMEKVKNPPVNFEGH